MDYQRCIWLSWYLVFHLFIYSRDRICLILMLVCYHHIRYFGYIDYWWYAYGWEKIRYLAWLSALLTFFVWVDLSKIALSIISWDIIERITTCIWVVWHGLFTSRNRVVFSFNNLDKGIILSLNARLDVFQGEWVVIDSTSCGSTLSIFASQSAAPPFLCQLPPSPLIS